MSGDFLDCSASARFANAGEKVLRKLLLKRRQPLKKGFVFKKNDKVSSQGREKEKMK